MATSHRKPSFSVVICTHNRSQELARCLEGVQRQRYESFEILVVDSAPADAAALEVARRSEVVYAMEPRPGLSLARNLGLRMSAGDYIAFLDDDAVPHPDWLAKLATEFADESVAAVAGRNQEPRHAWDHGVTNKLYSRDNLGTERRRFSKRDEQWFEIANFGGVGCGMNMAFRRSALSGWPGFDVRLGRGTRLSGGEENYAFFWLMDQGHQVAYTPEALIYHPCPPDLEAVRQRQFHHLSAATGYMTLLFFEQPQHRRRLVRYLVEALRGVPRTWRAVVPPKIPRLISRRRAWSALLLGPVLYLRTRLERAAPSGACRRT